MVKKHRALVLLPLVLLFCYGLGAAVGASPLPAQCRPDVNLDGKIDLFDLVTVSRRYGEHAPLGSQEDTNEDGIIDLFDLVCVATNMRPCDCAANHYDCEDFSTQGAAQACYEYCLRITGYDVHWLDGDGDGIACEWDPGPEPAPTQTPQPAPSTPILTLTRTPGLLPTPTTTQSPTPAPPLLTQAQVIEVIDGDTIKVLIGGRTHTVRYIGIDTPETVHPDEPVGWMGKEASDGNKALVEGKTVYLERDISETDKYGRLLRYAWIGDSMVNAELVRLGLAQVSTNPPNVKYVDLLLRLQQEAREAGRGLWGPTPTAALPSPTATLAPTQPVGQADVVIRYVFYDGLVPRVESDEYAEILNQGSGPVNLAGWRLNAGDAGQDFIFPGFVQQPGQACRVYTNDFHLETCGFSFSSPRALWNNDGDECGSLYDHTGRLASQYCY